MELSSAACAARLIQRNAAVCASLAGPRWKSRIGLSCATVAAMPSLRARW